MASLGNPRLPHHHSSVVHLAGVSQLPQNRPTCSYRTLTDSSIHRYPGTKALWEIFWAQAPKSTRTDPTASGPLNRRQYRLRFIGFAMHWSLRLDTSVSRHSNHNHSNWNFSSCTNNSYQIGLIRAKSTSQFRSRPQQVMLQFRDFRANRRIPLIE